MIRRIVTLFTAMRLKPGTAGEGPPPPLDAGRQAGLQALIISILLRRVDGVSRSTFGAGVMQIPAPVFSFIVLRFTEGVHLRYKIRER